MIDQIQAPLDALNARVHAIHARAHAGEIDTQIGEVATQRGHLALQRADALRERVEFVQHLFAKGLHVVAQRAQLLQHQIGGFVSHSRTLYLSLVLALLSGCAQLAQNLPSLRYCDSVKYERAGRDINLTAHCFEAVEPAMVIPVPKP